jgi:anti-sigma factor RsiW
VSCPVQDDTRLQAWIDRRLDEAQAGEVEALLRADPVLSRHALHCRRQNALLVQALAQAAGEPIPERLRAAVLAGRAAPAQTDTATDTATDAATDDPPAPGPALGHEPGGRSVLPEPDLTLPLAMPARPAVTPGRWRGWPMAAMVVLALGAGFAGGWFVRGGVMPPEAAAGAAGLGRAAAVAHAAFVPEVRHPVEVAAAEQAHLVAWLSKRLGSPVRVPDLGPEGYALVGGRLLPDPGGTVAAQFMFESTTGERLTLFVRRDPGVPDTAFRLTTERGLSTFYWMDRGFGYALSGSLGRDALLPLARSVHRQISP